ncbi:MAG TPA: carboxymuconolactone decarboxylase family protein [Spirochaetia bacterium]|nr:carboxymuconolactone decarboxylase family protein [Spirochaetia bacterium]
MPEDPLAAMSQIDPQAVQRMRGIDEWVFADGALSRKVKLLMAMAFDAADGAPGGVRGLAHRAMTAGATKEEIGETLRVAWLMKGVGSLYIASEGLKDLAR